MAFTTFVSGTAADADEVTANFYHIAQGDRLPRGGTSLDPTDSVYNIGATATTWANLYADTVNCTSVEITGSITSDLMPYVKYEYAIDSTHTSTGNIEFTGLTGDSDGEYIIHFYVINSVDTDIYLYFNNDTTPSNYYSGFTFTQMILTVGSPGCSCASGIMSIIPEGGKSRLVFSKTAYQYSSSYGYSNRVSTWINDEDEITSITFAVSGSFLTGTSIQIWALPS